MKKLIVMVFTVMFVHGAWAEGTHNTESSRYVISADGSEVYDRKTDLTWQRCSVGQRWGSGIGCVGIVKKFSFDQAQRQASGKWRVPSKDELASLVDRDKAAHQIKPAIDTDAFPDMDEDKLWYWTSTPSETYAAAAWSVAFGSDHVSGDHRARSLTAAVRLVKSGP